MLRAYSSRAVRDAEAPLLAAGEPLMAHAASALATQVLRHQRATGVRPPGTTVLLLVGGGDNGGDALYAGALLARRGAAVRAALLAERVHEDGLAAARDAGVRIENLAADPASLLGDLLGLAAASAVWIDGLLGIGARGGLREPLAQAVAALEHERAASPDAPFVVAVDVPSGVGVDDGSLPGPVLRADLTVAMGALKPAHLVPPAAALCGRVEVVELGLLPGLLTADSPVAAREQASDVADLWPVPARDDHKYSRGVLHVLAGSPRFPGAAALVVGAAQSAGLGMIRLEADPEVQRLVLAARHEIVLGAGRAQAHVVGPGLDEDDAAAMRRAAEVVREAGAAGEPTVLDATGLVLLDRNDLTDVPPGLVLTPHAGELARILAGRGEDVARAEVEAAPGRHARLAAELTGATVLLKGPVTVVAAPDGPLLAQADSTSWLATAGAGDVLSGLLGALLAGHGDRIAASIRAGEDVGTVLARLAAAAVLVHGHAARRASAGGPIAALDVAHAVAPTVRDLLTTDAGEAW